MSLEYQILNLLEFKVRGSTLTTLAKQFGTSEEKLSVILDSMVDEEKLVKTVNEKRYRCSDNQLFRNSSLMLLNVIF